MHPMCLDDDIPHIANVGGLFARACSNLNVGEIRLVSYWKSAQTPMRLE
jgi:hypothetical protein